MDSNVVLEQVLVLFLVMMVGVYARKQKFIDDGMTQRLANLLLNVTMPLMIIASFHFQFSRDMLLNAVILFAVSMGIHFISALLGIVLFYAYPVDVRNILRFITVFSNCAFMGFPVLESLYGRIGIFYGSIYVISFNLFIWTYGVMLFKGKNDPKSVKKALLNPGIIAVAIGMCIFVFSIQLPYPIFRAMDMVGSMTIPISMLIVGALLAQTDLKSVFSGSTVYYGTAIRLIVLPLASFVTLRQLGVPDIILGISVLLVAMPAAANTAIFAETYKGDSHLASRLVAISTLVSLVTIPLVVFFL